MMRATSSCMPFCTHFLLWLPLSCILLASVAAQESTFCSNCTTTEICCVSLTGPACYPGTRRSEGTDPNICCPTPSDGVCSQSLPICCGDYCCSAEETCVDNKCVAPAAPPAPEPSPGARKCEDWCEGLCCHGKCYNSTYVAKGVVRTATCCETFDARCNTDYPSCCQDFCCKKESPVCCSDHCCSEGTTCCGKFCCDEGVPCIDNVCQAPAPPPAPEPSPAAKCEDWCTGLCCHDKCYNKTYIGKDGDILTASCCETTEGTCNVGYPACCNDFCCKKETPVCCSDYCCPEGTTCCGTSCCEEGKTCVNNVCQGPAPSPASEPSPGLNKSATYTPPAPTPAPGPSPGQSVGGSPTSSDGAGSTAPPPGVATNGMSLTASKGSPLVSWLVPVLGGLTTLASVLFYVSISLEYRIRKKQVAQLTRDLLVGYGFAVSQVDPLIKKVLKKWDGFLCTNAAKNQINNQALGIWHNNFGEHRAFFLAYAIKNVITGKSLDARELKERADQVCNFVKDLIVSDEMRNRARASSAEFNRDPDVTVQAYLWNALCCRKN